MEIAHLPPLRMVRGQPFSQVWQFRSDGVAMSYENEQPTFSHWPR